MSRRFSIQVSSDPDGFEGYPVNQELIAVGDRMRVDDQSVVWLRSEEARKILAVTTCKLAHLRSGGEIEFKKSGNAYLYSANDCQQIAMNSDCGRDGEIQAPDAR